MDESTEEPPPRRRSSTKLAEDEDEPTEEPPPEPREEPPKVPPAIRDHNTAPEAQEEPVYTDTGRRKRSAAKKVNYDDSVRDKDFFRAVNKHDADKYPDNGHLSEGDDEILSDDESDSDGPRRATAKKWKEPVEKKKKRGRPRKQDKDEAPPPVLDPSDGAAAMVLRMVLPQQAGVWSALLVLALLAIVQQLVLRLWNRHRFAVPLTHWWLMGAGGLLVGGIGPVSVWKTLTGRGWTWKGRELA